MSTNYTTNNKELVTTEQGGFATYDLGLAAALITKGFELGGMDRSNPRRVLFSFGPEDDQLKSVVNAYLTDRLNLQARSYFDNLRAVKNRLHDAV